MASSMSARSPRIDPGPTSATASPNWPTTKDLGMTPRTEELTRLLAADESPMNS